MSKHRFRSFIDDGLFVVLIMAAAIASAAMDVAAVLGAFPNGGATRMAGAGAGADAASSSLPQAAASSVDGALLSVAAAQRHGRTTR